MVARAATSVLLMIWVGAAAADVCQVTVPIDSNHTHLGVGGQIMGLTLRLSTPESPPGASAAGNVTLSLLDYTSCPAWGRVRYPERFWNNIRFALDITFRVVPDTIVIKAGGIPITAKHVMARVQSTDPIKNSESGFATLGHVKIFHGSASAMDHTFALTTEEEAIHLSGQINPCGDMPAFELLLNAQGSFTTMGLPGKNSHIDITADVVGQAVHTGQVSGAVVTAVEPAGGLWNQTTMVTVSGQGLKDGSGEPLHINLKDSEGTLHPCLDPLEAGVDPVVLPVGSAETRHQRGRGLLLEGLDLSMGGWGERRSDAHLLELAEDVWDDVRAGRAAARVAPGGVWPGDLYAMGSEDASPVRRQLRRGRRDGDGGGSGGGGGSSSKEDSIVCAVPKGVPGDQLEVQIAGGSQCGAKKVLFQYSGSSCGTKAHAGCMKMAHTEFDMETCDCDCVEGFLGDRCSLCDAMVEASCGSASTCLPGDFRFYSDSVTYKHYQCTPSDVPDAFKALSVTVTCEGERATQGKCRLEIGGATVSSPATAGEIVCEARGCNFGAGTSAVRCDAVACDMGTYKEAVRAVLGRDTISGSISFTCNESQGRFSRCIVQVSDLPIPISGDCSVSECVPNSLIAAMNRNRLIEKITVYGCWTLAMLLVVALPMLLWWNLRKPMPPAPVTPLDSAGGGGRLLGRRKSTAIINRVCELRFEGLTVTAGTGRRIVSEVSGVAHAGECLGLMGPSGSGKTSFMDVVAGIVPAGSTCTGKVTLDGRRLRLGASYPPSLIAYCQQNDLLPVTMSARECVVFAALLTLPTAMDKEEKIKRADDALAEVNLTHIQSSIVGDATTLAAAARVSGGERRRISLAMALVASPSVLLCDEVTSGLDSSTAYAMIQTLKALAGRGRVVLLSIHQPSSRAFMALDRLMLLRKGALVLAAPTASLMSICDTVGLPCAPGFNIADHLLDVIQDDRDAAKFASCTDWDRTLDTTAGAGGSPVGAGRGAAAGLNQTAMAGVQEEAEAEEDDKVSSVSARGLFSRPDRAGMLSPRAKTEPAYGDDGNGGPADFSVAASTAPTSAVPPAKPDAAENVPAGKAAVAVEPVVEIPRESCAASLQRARVELSVLFWRASLSIVRHPSLLRLHLVVGVGSALIVGGLFHGLGDDVSGLQNRMGAVFFVLALFGFSGLSAMEVFMGEMALSLREMRNGYYRMPAMLMAKISMDVLLLRIVPAFAFSAIFYSLVNFDPALSHFVAFLLTAVLVNVAAGTLVAALSIPFDSLGSANLCATILMLVLLLLNGALLNLSSAPPAIALCQKLSFFRFGFEAMLGNELHDKVVMVEAPGVDPFPLSANLFLSLLGIDPTQLHVDIIMLAVFSVVHCLGAGLLLKWKTMRKTVPSVRELVDRCVPTSDEPRGKGSFVPMA